MRAAVLIAVCVLLGACERQHDATTAQGGSPMAAASSSEHAVLIHIPAGEPFDFSDVSSLEDELVEAIGSAGAGEFDGNEIHIESGDVVLFMYGPDADALFAAVEPVVRGRVPAVSYAIKRYGEPGARQERVALD